MNLQSERAPSLGPAGYRKFAAQVGSDVGVGLLLRFRLRLSAFGPERPALVRPVTYIPPPPEMVPELMNELVTFANSAPREVDPIVAASVASFGFVFIHPFMDGNGRLITPLFGAEVTATSEETGRTTMKVDP